MDQHTSILFRIPRELRDDIYEYYVLEETGKLQQSTVYRMCI
jgi:hypothetical protein